MIEILAEVRKNERRGRKYWPAISWGWGQWLYWTPWGWVVRNSKFKQSFTFFMINMQ